MQARGKKQRELVEDTPRELQWIELGSLVRDFLSAVEHGGIPEFFGRLKARARTNGKMESRYLAGKKWKIKRFQLIIKVDAVAVVMVVGIVSETVAAKEGNRTCDFMESWTTWNICGATLHRTGHAKESSNCNVAGDPDSPRKQVQNSAKFPAEVSRVRMLHCCRQRY